jgi:hypothetical protein
MRNILIISGVLVMNLLVVGQMRRRSAARLNQSVGQIYQTFRTSRKPAWPMWLNIAAVVAFVMTVLATYIVIKDGPG